MTDWPGDEPEEEDAGEEAPRGRKTVSSRRALGPAPRPGSRYSLIVGVVFAALIVVAFYTTVHNRENGVLGLEKEEADLPLAQFAVPDVLGGLDGDANVAQDDCETGELPCPPDRKRNPACEVDTKGTIRICDYFDLPLVISFWFIRGGDCVTQQDVVSRAAVRYKGRVNFVSIDVRDGLSEVRKFAETREWKMPVGYDRDGALSNVYRVGGCPTFAFAFPGGILESAYPGELSDTDLADRVEMLIADTKRKAAVTR